MFLMIGVQPGRREIEYNRTMICGQCGEYSRYSVYMTYMSLLLFFIPVLKWDRKYYVQSRCCASVYLLDPEIGKRIAAGEDIEIRPEHLTAQGPQRTFRRCPRCGYTTEENFDFCPKCGTRM